MSKNHEKLPPHSFRIQIYRCTEHRDDLGNVTQEYGELLWEEPPGREITWEVPSRWNAAQGHTDCLVAHHRCRVAVGIKPLFDDAPFRVEYFDSWPWSAERSARDTLVLTAGIGGRR